MHEWGCFRQRKQCLQSSCTERERTEDKDVWETERRRVAESINEVGEVGRWRGGRGCVGSVKDRRLYPKRMETHWSILGGDMITFTNTCTHRRVYT